MTNSQQSTGDQPAGTTDQSLGAKILWLKGLWALAGAALATAAGVALYIYMWNIGGVPIAQLSSVAVFSKIIVPTAIFLCVLLLAVWLTPLIVVAGLLSDKIDLSLKRLFDHTPAEPEAAAPTQQSGGLQAVESVEPVRPASSDSAQPRLKPPPFNVARIFGFAASTAGLASLRPVVMSMMPHCIDKTQQSYWFAASGLAYE